MSSAPPAREEGLVLCPRLPSQKHTNMCAQGINNKKQSTALTWAGSRETNPAVFALPSALQTHRVLHSHVLQTGTHEESNNAQFQLQCRELLKSPAPAAAPALPGDQDVPCSQIPPEKTMNPLTPQPALILQHQFL